MIRLALQCGRNSFGDEDFEEQPLNKAEDYPSLEVHMWYFENVLLVSLIENEVCLFCPKPARRDQMLLLPSRRVCTTCEPQASIFACRRRQSEPEHLVFFHLCPFTENRILTCTFFLALLALICHCPPNGEAETMLPSRTDRRSKEQDNLKSDIENNRPIILLILEPPRNLILFNIHFPPLGGAHFVYLPEYQKIASVGSASSVLWTCRSQGFSS
uniref:UDENN domain-containing protein n=1 Tax=Steinernema glaseri TaxID=37863 RepID=A0A1I8AKL5_9BILA